MANAKEQTLFTEAEDALLNVDYDPKEKTPTTAHEDAMFSDINMNQSLKRLHPSNTDSQLDPKRRKYSSKDEMSASDGSDDDGDDSEAELQALYGIEVDKTSKDKTRARLEQSDGGNDPLLSEIAEDLLSADESGPAAEKQLAEFNNNLCGLINWQTQN